MGQVTDRAFDNKVFDKVMTIIDFGGGKGFWYVAAVGAADLLPMKW